MGLSIFAGRGNTLPISNYCVLKDVEYSLVGKVDRLNKRAHRNIKFRKYGLRFRRANLGFVTRRHKVNLLVKQSSAEC